MAEDTFTDNFSINSSDDEKEILMKNLLQKQCKTLQIKPKRSRISLATKKFNRKIKREKIDKIIKNRKKEINSESIDQQTDSEDDLPLAVRLANVKTRETSNVIFPQINRKNWINFKSLLSPKQTQKNQDHVKLEKCLARMHGYEAHENHFKSLYFIRRAIVDSLLSRKWDNLAKLLVMLIQNYSDPVFTMFIRHLCQILKTFHPQIRGTELEEQFNLIADKYRIKTSNKT